MDSAWSPGTDASETIGSFKGLVRYLELRLQLVGLESRERGLHLLVLALLLVTAGVCFFVGMMIVFLLYLMMLTLQWDWSWSALALAGCFF
jgi:uncharacterized membrane protein YqjE